MSPPRLRSITDVVERQMCSGCGVCAYLSPDEIRMVDVLEHGRRPELHAAGDPRSAEAFAVCPGAGVTHETTPNAGAIPALLAAWGPVLEVWEGHAAAADVRWAASSGGVGSALALYCIERAGMHGVLHIAARRDVPYLNHTVLSRSREELLGATGSRYAPASPCDGLDKIEASPSACVFIGKPCDVAGVAAARRRRPALDAKLGLTIAIFCAGTPSTAGTLELLRRCGVEDPSKVLEVRYRGRGWPGLTRIRIRTDDGEREYTFSYEEAWGLLQSYRQWRCHVCAEHTGELADIAVGDPWYREIEPGEPGHSLVLVRTERGRALLAEARAAGYLKLDPADPAIVPASQPNLLRGRGTVWGRIHASRLLGAATPRYRGFPMFRFWWSELGARAKLSSVAGTWRRVITRRLLRRIHMTRYEPPGIPEEGP